MNKLEVLCHKNFPLGHKISIDGDMIFGEAILSTGPVAILGTINQASIGIDLAFSMATKVIEIIEKYPQRPIIILVDTQGQKLSKRDELLGNTGYLSHLSKCFEYAREKGHRIISIIYNEAVSGGYLALGLIADESFAVSDAQIRVMALPAMSRITQIPLDQLEELCNSSPIFAPGIKNYIVLGAIEDVTDENLCLELEKAVLKTTNNDIRAKSGLERGGRSLAYSVINSVIDA